MLGDEAEEKAAHIIQAMMQMIDSFCRDGLFLAAESARRNLRDQRRPSPRRSTEPRAVGRRAPFRQTGLAHQPPSHLHRDLFTLLRLEIPERNGAGGGC